jgi:hypothetical protein
VVCGVVRPVTFASLLVALGTEPRRGDVQIGHTDASFTLRVYRHGMRRDEDSKGDAEETADYEVIRPVEPTGIEPVTSCLQIERRL